MTSSLLPQIGSTTKLSTGTPRSLSCSITDSSKPINVWVRRPSCFILGEFLHCFQAGHSLFFLPSEKGGSASLGLALPLSLRKSCCHLLSTSAQSLPHLRHPRELLTTAVDPACSPLLHLLGGSLGLYSAQKHAAHSSNS